MPVGAPSDRCPGCGAPVGSGILCLSCGRELVDRRIGRVLGERYRLDALVGQGAYARVYQATDLKAGLKFEQVVAVKFLHQRYAMSREQRERFQREANVLVTMAHPGIVRALDFGQDQGALYLVMELVRGRPLSELVLVDGHTLPLERVVAILDQVLEVLEVTHAAGIVHRDLKPDNILLVDGGEPGEQVKVLDFGLARIEHGPRLTGRNVPLGTPSYMSPEQAAGKDAGPPADIYAVGIILYLLMAGELPFLGDTTTSLIAQHISLAPPPVTQRGLRRPAPPAFEALMRRALAKVPADRPTTSEFRRALEAALHTN